MADHQFSLKVTAKAHTNIALIKYWGKRDDELVLPMNSSLSLTLDKFFTKTTVQFCPDLHKDIFIFNQNISSESETGNISCFLQQIRNMAGKERYAIVQSENNMPTAAGFASSASGYAALAAAAAKAIGLNLSYTDLSRLARLGSGSACRSIFGGYVEWNKGTKSDGTDSFAQQIEEQNWNLSIVSALVTGEPKPISSREGMKRTVETSPFYESWVVEAEKDLLRAKAAIKERNFGKLGEVIEENALKMHATTLSATPPFLYWQGATVDVMQKVRQLRSSGIQAYFTIDAGPNVKVLCRPEDEQVVHDELLMLPSVKEVYICHPGPGVEILSETK